MAAPKFHIKSNIQPNQRQGDEIYDKWKHQQNVEEQLSIQRDRLGMAKDAAEQAKKDKRYQYKGETDEELGEISKLNWESKIVDEYGQTTVANWTTVASTISSISSEYLVKLEESDLPEAEKARGRAQIESNPDPLIIISQGYNKAVEQLKSPEGKLLKADKSDELLSRLHGIVTGRFTPVINDKDYIMSFLDEDGNPFSVADAMSELNDINNEFNREVADVRLQSDLSKAAGFKENLLGMTEFKNGKYQLLPDEVLDESYLMAEQNFPQYGGNPDKNEGLRVNTREIEKKLARGLITKLNNAPKTDAKEDVFDSAYEYREPYMTMGEDESGGGYWFVPIPSKGGKSAVKINLSEGVDGDTASTSGIPTNVHFSPYTNRPDEVTIITGLTKSTIEAYKNGELTKEVERDGRMVEERISLSDLSEMYAGVEKVVKLKDGSKNQQSVIAIMKRPIETVVNKFK